MAHRYYLKIQALISKLIYVSKLAVLWVQQRWWAITSLAVVGLVVWGSIFYLLGYSTLKQQVQVIHDATFLSTGKEDTSVPWQVFSQLNSILAQIKLSEQTMRNLRNTLEEKEQAISRLNEQLYFYRAIVAPEDNREGVSVFSAKLGKPDQQGRFPFEIILRKHGKSDAMRKGTITVLLSDGDSSNAKQLAMKKFYRGSNRFSFRYFQRMEGLISLPQGFSPVKVRVRIASPGEETIEENWYWGDLLGGNHAYH